MLASVNTFSAASGDFAKTAAIFPPTTYNTAQSKNDGDLRKFPSIPYKTTQAGIGGNFEKFLSIPLCTA